MTEIDEFQPADVSVQEQEDFAALLRALTRADGFALYFVECNVPVHRREVAEVPRTHLDRDVVEVDLSDVDRSPERPSIDYVLERRLADAPDEAVAFVWGLDALLPSAAGDEDVTRRTLNEVNWRRGAWARLERPLVVWLPEYAIRFLARNAPDFFDWNSGLYTFETPESERSYLLQISLDRLEEEGKEEGLSKNRKRSHEPYLRSLLDEYKGRSKFDRKARADVLLRLVGLYIRRSNYERARRLGEEALTLSQETGAQEKEATAYYLLASIDFEQGVYDRAREGLEQALKIRQELENRSGTAEVLHNLAVVALQRGEYNRAKKELKRALQILRETEDREGEAAAKHNLAKIPLRRGEYRRASEKSREALQLCQEIGDQSGEAAAYQQLASISLRQENYKHARDRFKKALRIRKEIGDRSGEASTRNQLAKISAKQGSYDEAEEELEFALRIFQEIGDQFGEAAARHNLASTALDQEKHDRAREEFEKALVIRQKIGDRGGEAGTLSQLGILAGRERGRWKEGLRLLHVGYSILISIDDIQSEQIGPWIHNLTGKLGYDEDELKEDVEYAQQSYAKDRGWGLIQDAFPDADRPDDVPPPSEP